MVQKNSKSRNKTISVNIIRSSTSKNLDYITLETNRGKFELPKCVATISLELNGEHRLVVCGGRVKKFDDHEI